MRLNIVLPVAAVALVAFCTWTYLSGEIDGESYDAGTYMVDKGSAELVAAARTAMKDSKVTRSEFLDLWLMWRDDGHGGEMYSKKLDQGVGRETLRRAIARHGV